MGLAPALEPNLGSRAHARGDVVTRRHDRERPLVRTTNEPFGEWAQAFPNASCVASSPPLPLGGVRARQPARPPGASTPSG
jgi:hypothetical protein